LKASQPQKASARGYSGSKNMMRKSNLRNLSWMPVGCKRGRIPRGKERKGEWGVASKVPGTDTAKEPSPIIVLEGTVF